MNGKMPRVMWLLNHGAARRFEIPMLKACGFDEIFLPKTYPADPSFRSASVDFSEDQNLTIPADDLAVLNAADWYGDPGRDAWTVANRHFSVLFFIVHNPDILESISRNFKGSAIWRGYGLFKELSYSRIRKFYTLGLKNIEGMGNRFWFGEAYKDLHKVEESFLRSRAIYLPLGLSSPEVHDQWSGSDNRVFFVCPDIGVNAHYKAVFDEFKRDFAGLPYAIGGSQPIAVDDPNVLGFVPDEMHERNMRELRVMFYHSREPRHVHYHPFEAVRAGMPLVFMADGMLDRLGGKDLPGRARTIADARDKMQRLLRGDKRLAEQIRASQVVLLDPMRPRCLEGAWREGLNHVVERLESIKADEASLAVQKKRIAVIIPVGYRGGSLRGAKLLAEAILQGSQQAGEAVEVVLVHLDEPATYSEKDWADMPSSIKVRSFRWRTVDSAEAVRAMRYAGHSEWEPLSEKYLIVEDDIQQLCDCDLWVVISDRLAIPLLPLRTKILMVFDYLQRHYDVTTIVDQILLANRDADHILVTTEFTRQDALQYAGVRPSNVTKVPMLAPSNSEATRDRRGANCEHFLWTTNLGTHKNHRRALAALQLYYEVYDGRLKCHVTGVGTREIIGNLRPHLEGLGQFVANSRVLRKTVKFLGELSDADYRKELSDAAFLWHPAELDNGTFSVIEAAHFGVPSLSSDYPAMREIDQQFKLGLSFMNQDDPEQMAAQLHSMEISLAERQNGLASSEQLASQSVSLLAPKYWKVIREFI